MPTGSTSAPPIITIPSDDHVFHEFALLVLNRGDLGGARDFERRLRRIYPRVLVRERDLTAEPATWYVYRDGGWRPPDHDQWWNDRAAPRLEVSADGWIVDANSSALGLLGLDEGLSEPRHFTDFVVPGAGDDAMKLFAIVRAMGVLEATIVLQPATGDAIGVDIRVTTHPEGLTAVARLAADVEAPRSTSRPDAPSRVDYLPVTDVAFRAYAMRCIARMPDPAPDALALRLRRLYPHAQVETGPAGWVVRRDHDGGRSGDGWWDAPDLARIRYDAQALILEANQAATELFGRELVGHYWQEFVTAGSTQEVAIMLDILADVGAAESRFRMPRGDGVLLEFDSYTVTDGDEFISVFRPVMLKQR